MPYEIRAVLTGTGRKLSFDKASFSNQNSMQFHQESKFCLAMHSLLNEPDLKILVGILKHINLLLDIYSRASPPMLLDGSFEVTNNDNAQKVRYSINDMTSFRQFFAAFCKQININPDQVTQTNLASNTVNREVRATHADKSKIVSVDGSCGFEAQRTFKNIGTPFAVADSYKLYELPDYKEHYNVLFDFNVYGQDIRMFGLDIVREHFNQILQVIANFADTDFRFPVYTKHKVLFLTLRPPHSWSDSMTVFAFDSLKGYQTMVAACLHFIENTIGKEKAPDVQGSMATTPLLANSSARLMFSDPFKRDGYELPQPEQQTSVSTNPVSDCYAALRACLN